MEREDEIILGGKVFYANNGIIGIDANLVTYNGYDGSFPDFPCANKLTGELKRELADIMIRRWQDYKDKI